jgi:hypothetical protein
VVNLAGNTGPRDPGDAYDLARLRQAEHRACLVRNRARSWASGWEDDFVGTGEAVRASALTLLTRFTDGARTQPYLPVGPGMPSVMLATRRACASRRRRRGQAWRQHRLSGRHELCGAELESMDGVLSAQCRRSRREHGLDGGEIQRTPACTARGRGPVKPAVIVASALSISPLGHCSLNALTATNSLARAGRDATVDAPED